MKVFFTASYTGKAKYQEYYDKIIESIIGNSAEVISLEKGTYSDLIPEESAKKLSKEQIHYQYIKKGILESKAAIIEASEDNFRLGHEATLAILLNKPVLCISSKKDFAKHIMHPKFFAAQVSSVEEIEPVVSKFLNSVRQKNLTVRFNGYLSPEQKNFLDWYGRQTNRTVSEIIRQLIEDKMAAVSNYEGPPEIF